MNRLHRFTVSNEGMDRSDLVLVRHGQDDETYIDGKFDNPLLSSSHASIKMLGEQIFRHADNDDYRNVRIVASPKRRTAQTSELLADRLSQYGMPVSVEIDQGVRELYQGIHRIDGFTYDELVRRLQLSWAAYALAIKDNDLDYRFGSPDSPILSEQEKDILGNGYVSHGENQTEFLERVYRFLLTIVHKDSLGLDVVVAHQATVSKAQRVLGVCAQFGSQLPEQPASISAFEHHIQRKSVGPAEGVVVSMPVDRAHIERALSDQVRILSMYGQDMPVSSN